VKLRVIEADAHLPGSEQSVDVTSSSEQDNNAPVIIGSDNMSRDIDDSRQHDDVRKSSCLRSEDDDVSRN